ncbi:hypothetical protein F4802DRAFT_110736 [Xylaria palmicola]|nr:hypothetical protein F4802DRAFT_110736 [Xylaria palmicola]
MCSTGQYCGVLIFFSHRAGPCLGRLAVRRSARRRRCSELAQPGHIHLSEHDARETTAQQTSIPLARHPRSTGTKTTPVGLASSRPVTDPGPGWGSQATAVFLSLFVPRLFHVQRPKGAWYLSYSCLLVRVLNAVRYLTGSPKDHALQSDVLASRVVTIQRLTATTPTHDLRGGETEGIARRVHNPKTEHCRSSRDPLLPFPVWLLVVYCRFR